jgi:hypothetical protein
MLRFLAAMTFRIASTSSLVSRAPFCSTLDLCLQVEVRHVHAREKVMRLFERPDVRLTEADDDRFSFPILREGEARQERR